MDISIFIPIYGESDRVEKMLTLFANQNVSKEIFVAVDEPTETFSRKIKDLKGENVTFIINSKRNGKANALNHTVGLSSGEVLLFLDSDIDLPDDPEYLKKIIRKMQHTDILDIKKRVIKGQSFLSKMAYYEYLSFNINSWLSSHFMQKCPAVNGSAFAMRRDMFEKVQGFRRVVAEDIDIATRAFLKDSRFAYSQEVEVQNVVYSNWRQWYTQRKRWAVGQALWFKEWYRELANHFIKKPQVFLPGLFFLYPSVAIMFISAVIPSLWMYNSLLIFHCFSQLNSTLPYRFFWFLWQLQMF